MPRYTRQYDQFRCGPVAIANVMKWAGADFSYRKNKKQLDRLVKISRPEGSKPKQITKALRKIGHKHLAGIQRRRLDSFTPTQTICAIRKHIDAGGVVLMNERRWEPSGEGAGHYYVIVNYSGDMFTVINYFYGNTINRLHEKYLRDELQRCPEYSDSFWLLRKKR